MARGFVYRERGTDAIQKRASQQGGDFKGFIKDEFEVYTAKKGENYIRILPPTWDNPAHFGFDVWAHYSVGPDNATLLCLHKMQNKRCPICEAVQALERAGDDDEAKQLSARRRVLVWMLDRKEDNKGPQLWAMPWTVDRDIAKVSQDRQSGEYYVVDHPDRGYDISFDKEGEKVQTKYTGVNLARRPTSVDPEFLEYVNEVPVPETLLWRDYNEMMDIYAGGMVEPEPEREVAPPRRALTNGNGAAPSRRPLSAPPARRPVGPRRPEPDPEPEYEEEVPPGEYEDGQPEYAPEEEYQPPARVPTRAPPPQRPALAPRSPAPARTPSGQDKAMSLRERYARK
jgi:hypothetical protein